jgi:hypothetical protein
VRIDRAALIRGLAAAVVRERERRQAAERAEGEAARRWLIDKIEEMARRLVAVPRAGDRALAKELAQATDWARVDELRMPADLSRADAVALAWTESPEVAAQLLCDHWSRHD